MRLFEISLCVYTFVFQTGYKCAIVCVTLLDRLQGDQV